MKIIKKYKVAIITIISVAIVVACVIIVSIKHKESNIENVAVSQEELSTLKTMADFKISKDIRNSLDKIKNKDQDWLKEHSYLQDETLSDVPEIVLLGKVSQKKLNSRLIVLDYQRADYGGYYVQVLFLDEPDEAYSLWMYPLGHGDEYDITDNYDWDLRAIMKNDLPKDTLQAIADHLHEYSENKDYTI